ncbi:unnamed protein product [Diatraea saccharalis]|uniref:Uncharacterized protein n=1 Tax=Diatraea saccharalis TaxID=40085 RepID=A0A9N9R5C9_9NEOP|nr:unnamed protein product [Diatraea saccharalis]
MLSEKFEEIADKIADKAVQKITDIKDFELRLVKRNMSIADPVYRVTEKRNVSQEGMDRNFGSTTVKYTVTNSNLGEKEKKVIQHKVNESTDTSFEERLVPINGLSLKYKHFTKMKHAVGQASQEQLNRDKSDDMDQIDEELKVQNNTSEEQSNNDNSDNKETNTKSAHVRDEILDTNKKKSLEFQLESSNENYVYKTEKKEEDDEETAKHNTDKSNEADIPMMKTNSDEQDSLNEDFEKNYKAYIEYKKQQNKKEKTNQNNPVAIQDSPSLEEDAVETLDQNQSSEEKINEPEYTAMKKSKSKHTTNLDETPMMIRKEGNKIYTYERSPDYDEYHQELAKNLKSSGR